MRALAAALEQWPARPVVWGTAEDGAGRAALVYGVTRAGVLVIDEPIVVEAPTIDLSVCCGVTR